MQRFRAVSVFSLLVFVATGGTVQNQDPRAIVEKFFPQSLIDLNERAGTTFTRNQCFAVYDTEPPGVPRTIIAAYTDP
jgi:hypothetical protein